MKTFLWTSLFWILAAIACLLCLGFGNLWTQVRDNWWIASIMPRNLKAESCDAAVTAAMQNVDWCGTAKNHNCGCGNSEDKGNLDIQGVLDSINILSSNQETIYNQMNESFATLLQNFSSLAEMCNSSNNIAYSESVYSEPAYQEPAYQEPAYQEPAYQEPAYQEPVYSEPVYSEPAYREPVYQEPVYQEPVYQEPVYSEPVYQEPVYPEPVYQEPVYSEPVYSEPIYY